MNDLSALKQANATRWANAKLLRKADCASIASHLVAPAAKARYQGVSAKTAVPWFVIAVIHERESSQDWTRSLAQGDPWNKLSVHAPAGRGPFQSWEEAAIDALVVCPPHAARNSDWSIGGALTQLEAYNGFGYASRGVPLHIFGPGPINTRQGNTSVTAFMIQPQSIGSSAEPAC
jgi:lysozyme family protein